MINVIGGTYREINYDDILSEIYGSGFRSCKFLLENKCDVHFYTSGNSDTSGYLNENKKVYPKFKFDCIDSKQMITFKYNFALDNPTIFPNILTIEKTKKIEVENKNIICFGMLETDFSINGEKVVYDPQTSIKPKKFSEIGSANELVYIVNWNEAKSIASSDDINKVKDFFFRVEKVTALIIKKGPSGAKLFYENKEFNIPSYITDNVNKIGSGDIFSGSFGYYWMKRGLPFEECAMLASKSTSLYCDKRVYVDTSNFEYDYIDFKSTDLESKQVYLAAPFFSLAELILIDKIRNAFLEFGVKVFSPFHDIGLGDNVTIAKKDLEGIQNSDIIFCVFDNLDSGTLIESGYSLALNKKIIGYHRTGRKSDLLMLKPGSFKAYDNLTTSIYNTIWNL